MNLSFLIDMNLPPAWVERFVQEGWQAVHWSEVGDPRATDTAIMDHARERGFVLFTHDLDFATILARTRALGPSVIQVRAQDITPEHLGALVVTAVRDHAALLEAGVLITVDEATMRARVLPIV
jgi:predicted nuclease of predicted toxin-antitoxin system